MDDYQTLRRLETNVADSDTICAQATATGRSGIGIIRLTGALCQTVAKNMLGFVPVHRKATLCNFLNTQNEIMDKGIAIFFIAPYSFTGEDMLELQAHGGPVLLDMICQEVMSCGVRLARPGEFSERAFLNKKIDLTQAEAIIDVINASSAQAVMSANRSMQGHFANKINALVEDLIRLRVFIESAIDFPEEEIDFIGQSDIYQQLEKLSLQVVTVLKSAITGAVLQNGISVVIVGKPNVGKSSLLNLLSGKESAIVTDIPGTTRDVLKEQIIIDGMPLYILDTAGLRESSDVVEQIGIQKARDEISRADCLLQVVEDADIVLNGGLKSTEWHNLSTGLPQINIYNKIDITGGQAGARADGGIGFSAKTGAGLETLKSKLKQVAGLTDGGEGVFSARRRHLQALENALELIRSASKNLSNAPELTAEDLSQAQKSLSEITGQFTNDDLLGRIFADFCIGK